MLKMLLSSHDRIIMKELQIVEMFYKNVNFKNSDSMSDFILTAFFEFSIKSYITSEIPRS